MIRKRHVQKLADWTEQLNDVERMFGSRRVLDDCGTDTELVWRLSRKDVTKTCVLDVTMIIRHN